MFRLKDKQNQFIGQPLIAFIRIKDDLVPLRESQLNQSQLSNNL